MHKTIQVHHWLQFGVELTISKEKSRRRRLRSLNNLQNTQSFQPVHMISIDCPSSYKLLTARLEGMRGHESARSFVAISTMYRPPRELVRHRPITVATARHQNTLILSLNQNKQRKKLVFNSASFRRFQRWLCSRCSVALMMMTTTTTAAMMMMMMQQRWI